MVCQGGLGWICRALHRQPSPVAADRHAVPAGMRDSAGHGGRGDLARGRGLDRRGKPFLLVASLAARAPDRPRRRDRAALRDQHGEPDRVPFFHHGPGLAGHARPAKSLGGRGLCLPPQRAHRVGGRFLRGSVAPERPACGLALGPGGNRADVYFDGFRVSNLCLPGHRDPADVPDRDRLCGEAAPAVRRAGGAGGHRGGGPDRVGVEMGRFPLVFSSAGTCSVRPAPPASGHHGHACLDLGRRALELPHGHHSHGPVQSPRFAADIGKRGGRRRPLRDDAFAGDERRRHHRRRIFW